MKFIKQTPTTKAAAKVLNTAKVVAPGIARLDPRKRAAKAVFDTALKGWRR